MIQLMTETPSKPENSVNWLKYTTDSKLGNIRQGKWKDTQSRKIWGEETMGNWGIWGIGWMCSVSVFMDASGIHL